MKEFKEIRVGLGLIALLLFGTAYYANSQPVPQAYEAKIIQKDTKSWNGQRLDYPTNGQAEISTATIVIKKGQSLPWHIHEVPMVVYVLEGELTLEDDRGNKQVIKEGQTAIESVNTSHRGTATGKEDTELFAIYLGTKNLKNTKLDPHKH